MTKTEPHENPLIPNARLRQMFVAMAEMRVLDEHIAGLQHGVKARRRMESTYGQEACRVSTAIALEAGDLASDLQAGVGMGLLFGEKIDLLLERMTEGSSGKKRKTSIAGDGVGGRLLPWIEDVEDRLRMAMGAALSFKTLKRANLVVVYVRHGEVSGGVWRQVLKVAERFELPILFVVLPGSGEGKKRDRANTLSAKALSCGVPGIPVDASDAVALYRVTQESIGRMRGGGGPVLIECVASRIEGEEVVDPLVQMRGFLQSRKVCSEAWLNLAGETLRRRFLASK